MTLTIDITPEEGGRLQEQAHHTGMSLGLYVQQIVKRAADTPPISGTETAQDDPTLALFAQWDLEDATDDPEEITRRQQDGDELLASLRDNPLTLRRVTLGGEVDQGVDEAAA